MEIYEVQRSSPTPRRLFAADSLASRNGRHLDKTALAGKTHAEASSRSQAAGPVERSPA
jgi:hypothetical protein